MVRAVRNEESPTDELEEIEDRAYQFWLYISEARRDAEKGGKVDRYLVNDLYNDSAAITVRLFNMAAYGKFDSKESADG